VALSQSNLTAVKVESLEGVRSVHEILRETSAWESHSSPVSLCLVHGDTTDRNERDRGEAERNGRTLHAHPDLKELLQFISLCWRFLELL